MMTYFIPVLVVLAGVAASVQAPINAMLSKSLGTPIAAAFVSVAVSAIVLFVMLGSLLLLTDIKVQWTAASPWIYFSGGVLGVLFVTSLILGVPSLGVGAVVALVVSGQLFGGMVIDKFGLFGTVVRELSMGRFLGAVLLIAGVAMIRFL